MAKLVRARPYIILGLLISVGVLQYIYPTGVRFRAQVGGGSPSSNMITPDVSLSSGKIRNYNVSFTTTDQAVDVTYLQAASTRSWNIGATATGAGTINKCVGHFGTGGIFCNIGYVATGATVSITVEGRARGDCNTWGNSSGTISDNENIFMDYSPGVSIQTTCPDFSTSVAMANDQSSFIRGVDTSYDFAVTNSGTGVVPYYSIRGNLPNLFFQPGTLEFESVQFTTGSGHCTTNYNSLVSAYYHDTAAFQDLAENNIGVELGNNGKPVIAMTTGDATVDTKIVLKRCLNDTCTLSGTTVIEHVVDAQNVPIGGDLHLVIGEHGPVVLSTSHYNGTDEPFLLYCLDDNCSQYYKSRNSYGVKSSDEHDFILKSDGTPLIAIQDIDTTETTADNLNLVTVNCLTQSCATYQLTNHASSLDEGSQPDIVMGSDGLPIIAHRVGEEHGDEGLAISKCLTASCSAINTSYYYPGHFPNSRDTQFAVKPSIAIASDGFPIIVVNNAWTDVDNEDMTNRNFEKLYIAKCLNHDCSNGIVAYEMIESSSFPMGRNPIIKIGPDGLPFVLSFYEGPSDLLYLQLLKCLNTSCTPNNKILVSRDISEVNPHPTALEDHMHGNFVFQENGLPFLVYPVQNTELIMERCMDPECGLYGSPYTFVCTSPEYGLGAGSSAVIRATTSTIGLDCSQDISLAGSGYPLARITATGIENKDHNYNNSNSLAENIPTQCYNADLQVVDSDAATGAYILDLVNYQINVTSIGSFSTGVVISLDNADSMKVLGGYASTSGSCTTYFDGSGDGHRESCYIGFVGSGETISTTFDLLMNEDATCNSDSVVNGSGSSAYDSYTTNINSNNLYENDVFNMQCLDQGFIASNEACPIADANILVTNHTIAASGGVIRFGVYEQRMSPSLTFSTGSFLSGSGTCTTGSMVETVITRFSDIGEQNSLTIPSDNLPVITTVGNDKLKVIKCRDPYCEFQDRFDQYDVADFIPDGLTLLSSTDGEESEGIIDTNGNPLIAHAFTNNLLIVNCHNKHCSSSEYTKVAVDNHPPSDAALALGTDGYPTVTYHSNNEYLNILKCNDLECDTYTHNLWKNSNANEGSEFSGKFSDLVIGYDGNPIIIAMRSTKDEGSATDYYSLELLKCHDPACNTITDQEFSNGLEMNQYFPAIAINETGNPIIIHNNNSSDLASIYCLTASCSITSTSTIKSSDDLSGMMQIVIPPDNLPVLFAESENSNQGILVYKCLYPDCTKVSDITRNENLIDAGDNDSHLRALIHPKDKLPIMINNSSRVGGNNLIVIKCIDPSCEVKYHTGSVLCSRTDSLGSYERDTLSTSYDISGFSSNQTYVSTMTGFAMTGLFENEDSIDGTTIIHEFGQRVCSEIDLILGIQGPAVSFRNQTIRYTVTVSNSGSVTASGFTLSTTLPPTSKFVGYGVSGGSSQGCGAVNESVTCSHGELGPFSTVSFDIVAQFESISRTYCSQEITHTGSVVITAGSEIDLNNNADTVDTLITCTCGDHILDGGEECDVDGIACTENGAYCAQCIECRIYRSGGGRGGSRRAGGEIRPAPPPRPDAITLLPEPEVSTGSCCVGKNLQAGRCESGSLYGIELNEESCESPTFQGTWYSDPDGLHQCLVSDCEVLESSGACCITETSGRSCERGSYAGTDLDQPKCREYGGVWFDGADGMLSCVESGCMPGSVSCYDNAELFSSVLRLGGISCPELVLSTRYFGNGDGEIDHINITPKPAKLLSNVEPFLLPEPRGAVGTLSTQFESSTNASVWLRAVQADGNGGLIVSSIKPGESEQKLSANPDRPLCTCGTAVSIDFNDLTRCREERGYKSAMITVAAVNPNSDTSGMVVELQSPSEGDMRMDLCSLSEGSIRPSDYKLFDFPCGTRLRSTQTGGKPRIVFKSNYASFIMSVSPTLLKEQVKVTGVFEDGTMASAQGKTCKDSGAESLSRAVRARTQQREDQDSEHRRSNVEDRNKDEGQKQKVKPIAPSISEKPQPSPVQAASPAERTPEKPTNRYTTPKRDKLFLVLPPDLQGSLSRTPTTPKPYLILPSLLQGWLTK